MVDRITPTTTNDDIRLLAREFGIRDRIPVPAEDFMQWVLEDNFCNTRPPWENAGVQLVRDVTPFELMKLRLLNGSHSALTYSGCLAGLSSVRDAAADPHVAAFVRVYLTEARAAVPPVPGVDLAAYAESVLSRFRNPFLHDALLRIAADGSQKLQGRLKAPLLELLPAGHACRAMALALAVWLEFLADRDGPPVQDPRAEALVPLARQAVEERHVYPFLREAFGEALAGHEAFVAQVDWFVADFSDRGVQAVLQGFNTRHLTTTA